MPAPVVSVWFLATGSDHLMIEAAVANAVAAEAGSWSWRQKSPD